MVNLHRKKFILTKVGKAIVDALPDRDFADAINKHYKKTKKILSEKQYRKPKRKGV